MAFKIKLAETTELVDEAFKIRHEVFVNQENFICPAEDKRLLDRFDAFPSTKLLVLIAEEQVVGTLRLVQDSPAGLPSDQYFDFRVQVPEGSYLMNADFYCLSRGYRDTRLTLGVLLMAAYFAQAKGITHIAVPIDLKIAVDLEKIGFKVVGDKFVNPRTKVPMLPLILDMNDLNDFFLKFIEKNQLHDFLQDYERWFYKAGEKIITAGTSGEEAFIIIEGNAQVQISLTGRVIADLGPGDILGEMALITDDPRSADVVARTDLQVMALSKGVFLSRFTEHPDHAFKLIKILGARAQSLIRQLQTSFLGN